MIDCTYYLGFVSVDGYVYRISQHSSFVTAKAKLENLMKAHSDCTWLLGKAHDIDRWFISRHGYTSTGLPKVEKYWFQNKAL